LPINIDNLWCPQKPMKIFSNKIRIDNAKKHAKQKKYMFQAHKIKKKLKK